MRNKYDSKEIQDIIDRYLQNAETDSERLILYEWFESLGERERASFLHSSTSRKDFAKERFFTDVISQPTSSVLPNRFRRFRYVAASLVLLSSLYILYKYTSTPESMTMEELANHKVESSKPTITLSTGEVIVLDEDSDQSFIEKNGQTLIREKNGQWRYVNSAKVASDRVNVLQTPQNGQFCITLSDDTKVWLNAGSKLSYPEQFGEGDRIVQLEGEAYFQVSKTTNQSKFIVKTANQTVQVLGTKFNIKAYLQQKDTYTTLEEGAVKVESHTASQGEVVLKPSQQLVLSSTDFSVRLVDLEATLAWTQGFFYFDGNNTSEVLHQIATWYNIDITYRDGGKRDEYVGKIPQNLSLDQVVKLLEYAELKVKPTLKNNRINLLIN